MVQFFLIMSLKGELEYVTRKITQSAARIFYKKQKHLYLGDINIKIDWGYARDYVEAAYRLMQLKKPDFFVIGSGNAISIKYFAKKAFDYVGLDYKKYVRIDKKLYRKNTNKTLVADTSKVKRMFNFKIKTNIDKLVKIMMKNDLEIEKMIKNSILLCTYNEDKYIENTIHKLTQFIPDLEIIIVDDNSTDKTLSIINNLKNKFKLKIINRLKTKGLGSAFNRALID